MVVEDWIKKLNFLFDNLDYGLLREKNLLRGEGGGGPWISLYGVENRYMNWNYEI